MALTEQDKDWITAAVREGAFSALRDSKEDRERQMREQAGAVVDRHMKDCPYPEKIRAEVKLSLMRLIVYLVLAGALGGGSGGLVSYAMAAVKHLP